MAPMLFMKEDNNMPMKRRANRNWFSLNFILSMELPIKLTNPDSCRPLEMSKTNATMITAGWLNPINADSSGTIPSKTKSASAMSATASYLHFPEINATTSPPKISNNKVCSERTITTL